MLLKERSQQDEPSYPTRGEAKRDSSETSLKDDEIVREARAILEENRRKDPRTYDHELKFWSEHGLDRMFG